MTTIWSNTERSNWWVNIMANDLESQMAQVLTIYCEEINEKLRKITTESMKQLVKETKATAPIGRRKGQYKKNIAADYSGTRRSARGLRGQNVHATWYVKAPDYRLTHLLVKGHATHDGGRTTPNPFLQNATDHILPEYERKVEEVLSNGN